MNSWIIRQVDIGSLDAIITDPLADKKNGKLENGLMFTNPQCDLSTTTF